MNFKWPRVINEKSISDKINIARIKSGKTEHTSTYRFAIVRCVAGTTIRLHAFLTPEASSDFDVTVT
jgi:hypothetical protein